MFTYNHQLIGITNMSNDVVSRALRLYRRASLKGWLERLLDKVNHRESRLLDLNDYSSSLRQRGQHALGIQAVSIDQIRGTQGKGSDFSAAFAPLNERTRTRWLQIAIARLQRTPLPLVELIQIGNVYFVVDGHHRISVARALGEQMVDAEVTAWNVSGILPWEKQPSAPCLTSQPA